MVADEQDPKEMGLGTIVRELIELGHMKANNSRHPSSTKNNT